MKLWTGRRGASQQQCHDSAESRRRIFCHPLAHSSCGAPGPIHIMKNPHPDRPHWSDYSQCDHRSGLHTLERLHDEEFQMRAWQEECQGRRRLLLIVVVAWGLVGAAVAMFFTL